ncbi:Zn finger protein [Metarhizium acridum]|nr:Zn finger protein [Metarhizium acridum]
MPQHQACSTPPSPKRGRQHFRQVGQPMYMPAVLRPCHEFTSRKVTRCKTAGSTSSTDSDSTLRRANTAIMSIPGLSLFGRRLSRAVDWRDWRDWQDAGWRVEARCVPRGDGTAYAHALEA